MSSDRRFAVLIDADNVSDKYIKVILDEISNDGLATYKRIYGDWTKPSMTPWKKILLENSVTPMQQYGYTSGKNATDSAMIIDAMDILYSANVEGFCLVSSDSDFTRLAVRLRESGMMVVGMGEQKTPKAFVSACSKFKYLDILLKQKDEEIEAEAAGSKPREEQGDGVSSNSGNNGKKKSAGGGIQEDGKNKADADNHEPEEDNDSEDKMTSVETISKAIATIIKENADEDEWVFIGDIGNRLSKRYPDFDDRNYGFNKLTPFIKSLDLVDIKVVASGNSNNKLVYVKEKNG